MSPSRRPNCSSITFAMCKPLSALPPQAAFYQSLARTKAVGNSDLLISGPTLSIHCKINVPAGGSSGLDPAAISHSPRSSREMLGR
ncbi:hypothetical protein BDV37DRAFT_235616 [Aspergillus pseudonomiae]|uniref:Uncharacterized protein n=1 Tax=Aspergillus pseudonomiae TaxID=1506151 RepID=A0A5N7DVJ0_9EURO|nr:uncharacterized protein BDV37DRAFT_235616 [Aspergillus pseudonomiae]KAE8410073.1 hypothetical protein BDV37DRAFT_235616 [Aspergillus pseudonomiae]